ncbi:PREDICTED: proto-oncogene DBL [Nanorana parkeri]|uniref:proto-oncogene DBL n=1 Tax=Nanorana parkeri TaxID=125878 RepID=UPI000853FA79|nr:PREDICTED: proto-oncogene DBL [Nanorana parkeri]
MAFLDTVRITAVEMEKYYSLQQAACRLDSLLEETAAPICARDITDLLMKELAFLSGGRGKDNGWIMTFPENATFHEVPEDVLTTVLTYLTSIPSKHENNVKFLLVLDRRLDTWTSVKLTLQKLSHSFPGNLHLVLVLRPTGFFQRTFTDIGFRYSQEDFILKLPVVMLSSASDLLKYIDEKQLTPEFGGTFEYRHRDWVVFRTAIEGFALTVKEIAQMLQAFGTELAETELPGDIYSIEHILANRTEKYCQLKKDITSVMREGGLLLNSFEGRSTSLVSGQQVCEKSGDWDTVNRLLAQLHEMECAFDGFWEKHQLKMEQYLELLKFEQHFDELKSTIEFLMVQQAGLPDTGENLTDVRQRLMELNNLDERAQDLIARTQLVILHGHQLAANHHYALNLICQQCNELRHASDILSEEIRRKHVHLSSAQELHVQLQQVLECCDEGAYFLANQQMDKCQSRDGAQRALQDLEKFMESCTLVFDPQSMKHTYEVILTDGLKAQIEVVHVKMENMQDLFENRQASLKKLADKQVRPVQLVAPRPENPPRAKSPLFSPKHGMDFNSSLKFSFDITLPGKRTTRKMQTSRKIEVMHDYQEKRNSLQLFISESEDSLDVLKGHAIHELIETERIYVEELYTILLGYRSEMENPAMTRLMPPSLRNTKNILFGNMPEIYEFHNKVFLLSLESCIEAPERVGFCFLERREDFQMYEKYCHNKPRSDSLWRQFADSTFFQECQRKLEHKLALDSYLLKPIQRLTKYQLLLKELLKYSIKSEGIRELQEALVSMLDLLKSVNDSMHQIAITGYNGDINDLGRILMQGSFSVWITHKKGPTKMKELARFKPMQRHLFLYERALVFCKRREDHGDGHDKTPSYSFKHFLKMNAVGITENVKGDNRKFEIWYSGREEVYVVQAQTAEQKTAWLNEIRKILTRQGELMKVEKQKQNSFSDQVVLSPQISEGKLQRLSVSSEENDSENNSPITLESLNISPQHKPHKGWTGMSQSLEICEGLEGWSSSCACSDTEEEDTVQLSPGRYKALADCKKRGSDDVLVRNGDVIQLMQEDADGKWLVKNLNRKKEGWIHGNNLQIIIGECRIRASKLTDAALCTTRKLSSP